MKKFLWQTIYNRIYTKKCSKWLQWKMYIQCKFTLLFAICTENMELFKLYSKEKAIFFCLIKLLFIKSDVWEVLMLAWRLVLKGNGGKQHSLPFVGSKLGIEIFLKKREHQKRMRWNRGLRHLCILCIEVSRKFYAKPVCFLIVFWL